MRQLKLHFAAAAYSSRFCSSLMLPVFMVADCSTCFSYVSVVWLWVGSLLVKMEVQRRKDLVMNERVLIEEILPHPISSGPHR